MKNAIKKNGIILSTAIFTLSLMACSNYVQEFEDDYHDLAYADLNGNTNGDGPNGNANNGDDSGVIASSSAAKQSGNDGSNGDDSGVIASSSAAKQSTTDLKNCDGFKNNSRVLYDGSSDALFAKKSNNDTSYFEIKGDSVLALYEQSRFCIEYSFDGNDDSKYFNFGLKSGDSLMNLRKRVSSDSVEAFYAYGNETQFFIQKKDSTKYKNDESLRKTALYNVNYFTVPKGLTIKKAYVTNADIALTKCPSKNDGASAVVLFDRAYAGKGNREDYFYSQIKLNQNHYYYAMTGSLDLGGVSSYCVEYDNGGVYDLHLGEYNVDARRPSLNIFNSNPVYTGSAALVKFTKNDDDSDLNRINAFWHTQNGENAVNKFVAYGSVKVNSSSNISSSSGLQNCDAFEKDGGKLIYPLNNGNVWFTGVYVTSGYHLELNEDSEFCIEFTDKTKSDVQFTFGFMYPDTSVYFTYSSIEENSLAAEFEVDKESCLMNDSTQKTIAVGIECGENAKGNALKNINYFYYDVSGTPIKNIYVKNAEIKANSSSSSEPATTCPNEDGDWHTLYDSGNLYVESTQETSETNKPTSSDGFTIYTFANSKIKDFSSVDLICIEYENRRELENDTVSVRIGYNEQKNNDWHLRYVYWLPLPTGQSSTTVSLNNEVCNGAYSQDGCSDNNINFIDLPDSSKKHVFVQKIMYKGVIKNSEPANACPDVDGDWHTLYENDSLSISGGYCAYGSCKGDDDSYDGYTLEGFYDFSGVDSICIEYENKTEGEELKSQLGVHLGHSSNDNSGHGYQYVVPIIDDQNFYKVEFSKDLCDTNFLDGKCTFNISVIEFPNSKNSVNVIKVMYKGTLVKGKDPYKNDQQN